MVSHILCPTFILVGLLKLDTLYGTSSRAVHRAGFGLFFIGASWTKKVLFKTSLKELAR